MNLPLKLKLTGPQGWVTVVLTARGIQVAGTMTEARLDLLVNLWDVLVPLLALDEIDVRPFLGGPGAEKRQAEARAALQVRLWGQ